MRKKILEGISPWTFKGEVLDSIPEGAYGFVYCITEKDTGKQYIGKKAFYSYRTKISHILNEKTGRLNKVKNIEASESNWKEYYGSNSIIKKLIRQFGRDRFERQILRIVYSKKELTYFEAKEQFVRGVIEPGSTYYNDNILGKFYNSDFNKDGNTINNS